MHKCGFYACRNEGTEEATFMSNSVGRKLRITVKLCKQHDKYTKKGGELALLFRRVDPTVTVEYASLSGAAPAPLNPPPNGGE